MIKQIKKVIMQKREGIMQKREGIKLPVTMRRSAPAHSMLSPTSSDPLIRGEQISVPPLKDPPVRSAHIGQSLIRTKASKKE